MRRKLQSILLAALIAFGCDSGSGTDAGGIPTGTLQGIVKIADADTLHGDHSGITVTLDGTSFSATTTKDGRWKIEGLPTRNYTVVYSKPGYATYKRFSVLFIGGGIVETSTVHLYAMPMCGIELDVVREDSPGRVYMYAYGQCATSGNTDRAIFFLSNSPNVSSTNYQLVRFGTASRGEALVASTYEYDLFAIDKNDTIYVVAYTGHGEAYYDPTLKLAIYPAIYPQPSRVLPILLEK